MTSSTLENCQISSPTQQQPGNHLSQCQLQWRQGQLLVKRSHNSQQLYLSSLDSQQKLVQCLKHSPVKLVRIDATLGHTALKLWFNACEQAKKPVFLRQSVEQQRDKGQIQLSWYIQLIDWIATFILLMLLSPVMLAVAILQVYVYSPTSIFSKEYCVGSRGKIFQALRFRTTEVNNDTRTTFLGHWLCKYQLDKLPQLLNILRRDMSLFASHSLMLSDVVVRSSEAERHTKSLPCNHLVNGLIAES